MSQPIVCISELADDLGVERQTISDLMRKHGIQPKAVPRRRHAKGLDQSDQDLIRGLLTRKPEPAAAT